MEEKKQVKYDVDGYELVTPAIMDLINQYPGLIVGEKIKFSTLGEDEGIALFPISGAVIESERTSVTGKVTKICLYPFYIIYRIASLSSYRKEDVKEWLDNLGKWLEKEKIIVGDTEYKLSGYPSLTGKREFLEFRRQTPANIDSVNENQSENWAIYINARYRYEYYR